jgi:polyisoprenoid-binding protein YceI
MHIPNISRHIAIAATVLCLSPMTAIAADEKVKADTWTVDTSHSAARFTVRHMMVSNLAGQFQKVSGSVKYDGKNLQHATVDATIDATSVNTHDDKRDEHLRGKDFFETDKFPTISFKSKQVTPAKDGSFKILGTLTMHGVSRDVTLEAEPLAPAVKDPWGKTRTGTSASTKINRKDFGISYDKNMDSGGAMVGDDVKITLDIELVKGG